MSESDVYGRPILTSKVGPRTERVNNKECIMLAMIITNV